MKKIAYFLILLIWIGTGCQVTRKVDRHRNKDRTDIQRTTDSSAREVSRENTDTRTTETITVTEQADARVEIPGSSIGGGGLISELTRTGHFYLETNEMTLEVFSDSVAGVIRAQATVKPRTATVPINRTRTEQRSIASDSEKEKRSNVQVSQTDQERTFSQNKDTQTEVKRPFWLVWVVVAVIAIVIIGILALYLWRKKLF